jgi:metal-dependent amidase/aminoacylase/carboxypeptidase family protein
MAIITVGAFLAGEAPNVIPASAELRLTVRARSEAVRAQLRDRITAVAQAQAAVHGARAEVDYRWRYPVTMNDPEATVWAETLARGFAGEPAVDSRPAARPAQRRLRPDAGPRARQLFHRRQRGGARRGRGWLHGAQHRATTSTTVSWAARRASSCRWCGGGWWGSWRGPFVAIDGNGAVAALGVSQGGAIAAGIDGGWGHKET